MSRVYLCFVWLPAALVALNIGSGDAAQPAGSPTNLVLRYDTGTTPIGTTTSHDFKFTNPFSRRIAITEAGIHKTCSCTNLRLSTRELKPGEEATVTMAVATAAKTGNYAVSADCVWDRADGTTWTVQFEMTGGSIEVMRARPPLVVFSPDEVKNKTTQTVQFTIDRETTVDWTTLVVKAADPLLQIVGQEISANSAAVTVRAAPPDTGPQYFSTTLTAGVAVTGPMAKAIPSTQLAVPVRGRRWVELSISPAVAMVRLDPDSQSAKVQLLIRGESLPNDDDVVDSVECDGFVVKWVSRKLPTPTGSDVKSFSVSLALSSPKDRKPRPKQNMRIAVRGHEPKTIPVFVIGG